jgi:hypothetical protein
MGGVRGESARGRVRHEWFGSEPLRQSLSGRSLVASSLRARSAEAA